MSSFAFPFIPIDETRYLAVAWEMKLSHSFIVPHLNGLPYAHKPPFLFFLLNLDWLVFGINDQTLRFIPLLFSLFNILMIYKIALLLWEDKKIAQYASIVLTSMLIYLLWSTLLMFDIILAFWVLVGIYGLLSATKSNIKTPLMLIGLAIGGGLLTKGPVIFVHILPISLFYYYWRSKDAPDPKKWSLMIFGSILIGLAIVLLWVVPAVIDGGEAYRKALLWDQTAGRIASSFAHKREIWWYIPLLPVLLFPWVLVKPSWYGFSLIKHDNSYRFVSLWLLSTMIIFSLISGKQVHYLIPVLPAFSLLIAKNIATFESKVSEYSRLHYPLAIFYILAGVLLFLGKQFITVNSISSLVPVLALVSILLGGIMLFIRPLSMDKLIKIIALSSMLAFITLGLSVTNKYFIRYDLSNIAHILKEKQEKGYSIIHYKRYRGQYQFVGRLTQPLLVLSNKESVAEYLKSHKKVLLITYGAPDKFTNKDKILYQQPYRNKQLFVLEGKNINYFLNSTKVN